MLQVMINAIDYRISDQATTPRDPRSVDALDVIFHEADALADTARAGRQGTSSSRWISWNQVAVIMVGAPDAGLRAQRQDAALWRDRFTAAAGTVDGY
ncbi:MAG: hypothetical protein R3E03_00420 [Novosphingobium sp.]